MLVSKPAERKLSVTILTFNLLHFMQAEILCLQRFILYYCDYFQVAFSTSTDLSHITDLRQISANNNC